MVWSAFSCSWAGRIRPAAIAQSGGNGYRLKASILRREFALGGQFARLALRYTPAMITKVAQTAACYRHHTVDQQLCRWLLLSFDRRLPYDLGF
jgi:hypothetical protein